MKVQYPDEYEKPECKLSGVECDVNCPYWNNCPREELDLAEHDLINIFMDKVIEIIKGKRGRKSS